MGEALLLYGSAFALGAAHALEPGHGKSLIAAYLAGVAGHPRDALTLGALVTVFHTLSSLVLALAAVFLASQFLETQEAMMRAFGAVAGAVIIGMGVWLLIQRLRQHQAAANGDDEAALASGCCGHDHEHTLENGRGGKWRHLFALGLAGGITPCPIAITGLLAMVTVGGIAQWGQAVLFLVVFSLGLASVVVLIGLGSLLSSQHLGNVLRDRLRGASRWLGWASAVVMVALGGFLVWRSLFGAVELTETTSAIPTTVPLGVCLKPGDK